jgi:ketosteroid isomerase-like protein
MRSTIAGCILLVATCLPLAAQDGSAAGNESARIMSLENAWNQAEVKHDARAMSMLLAEIFDYTDDDGSFMNRAQWLAHIGGGVDQYEHLGDTGVMVHLYGNVAVVTGIFQYKIKEKGKSVARSGRFTDTWIHQNCEWKCVASQSTLVSH